MPFVGKTEENTEMKLRLMALLFALSLALGLPIAASAGPPGGADLDLDGVQDPFDNCLGLANGGQEDANHDGCGDSCSPPITCDANGDTAVGGPDFAILGAEFGDICTPANMLPCLADCNGDTGVGGPDFAAMGAEFGNIVGPSGITTAQCDTDLCNCTPQ
jgi:hypothetical protein